MMVESYHVTIGSRRRRTLDTRREALRGQAGGLAGQERRTHNSAPAVRPAGRWFHYGYCARRFTDSGAPKAELSNVDRRWDPRCKVNHE